MTQAYERINQPKEFLPIPEVPSVGGWKEIPIIETDLSQDPLVPVGIFSGYRNILSSSVYADEHHNSPYSGGLDGSNIAVFMREDVAKRLEVAATLLPRGHHIMVMDAYRSLDVQGALYKQYEQGLKDLHPEWTADELSTETQKYVSVPSKDSSRPSPHNTGGSVDVVIIKINDEIQQTIDSIDATLDGLGEQDREQAYTLEMKRSELIRQNGKMLNFGTRFDHGGSEAALRYFEVKAANSTLSPDENEAMNNRRMLYDVMIRAGLEPYADEWWHYNHPASQMGARVAGIEYAEYGAAEMSDENKKYELMRKLHHINTVRLARGEEWTPPKGLEEHYTLARAAIFGNPKNVWDMTSTVAKIKPSEDVAA